MTSINIENLNLALALLASVAKENQKAISSLSVDVGNKADLNTSSKKNLVAAINELLADQAQLSTDLTGLIKQVKTELLGGAPTSANTLKKLNDRIKSEVNTIKGEITTLTNHLNGTISRVDGIENSIDLIFDGGKIRYSALPPITDLERMGTFDPSTGKVNEGGAEKSLPAPSQENDGHFYLASKTADYDFGDGAGAQRIPAKAMLISDAHAWQVIASEDSIQLVNGISPNAAGNVNLKSGNIPYSSDSGLKSGSVRSAIDETAKKHFNLLKELGNPNIDFAGRAQAAYDSVL